MAITGIDTIEGKQIIAAGAVSAKSAEMAYNDENGNPITGYLTAVPAGTMNESAFSYDASNNITAYNGSAIGGGSAPAYGYTDNDLISSIDTSGLYATSAGTAASVNHLNQGGTMGGNILQTSGSNSFYYMPRFSPWTTADVATGIFSPLQYATGACLAMDAGYFKAYFKGNEWFVSNTAIGQALRGEVHQSRGVHISGATKDGKYFNLSPTAVVGVVSTANNYGWLLNVNNVTGSGVNGSWKYGPAEDAALRAVSSCDMHESAFEYDANDKISGYNGSAFAGGSDVPEGVMVESGLEYNAVQEISGYNGSAIAQYGAEKQWLVHDDTLVHAANSAQYALGVNLSAVAQLMGIDQTLLYSGTATYTGSLSESVENFDTIKVNYMTDDGMQGVSEFMPSYTKEITLNSMYVAQNSAIWFKATNYTFSANTSFSSYPYQLFKANNGLTAAWSNNTSNTNFRITRVVGIGRKS